MSARAFRFVVIITFFALLALLALHQPILHGETHMPGDTITDYYHFHWNYAWMRHALVNNLNIYETNFVFFPFVSSLAYHTLAPFWYPVWALTEPLIGTFAAFNLIFVIAFTLCGVSFYALLRREGVSPGLAVVGGAMLELSPLVFFAAEWSMTSLIAWFWLPLSLLTWGEIARARSWRTSLLAAVLFGVTLWAMQITDLQYALYLAFLIVPYGLWTLWQSRDKMRLIVSGVLALMIALALLWVGGTLPAILTFDRAGLAPTPPERAVAIPFPFGYIWHTENSNLPLGALVLPLTLFCIMYTLVSQRRRSMHPYAAEHAQAALWLIAGLAPLILSLSASLQTAPIIALPYRAFHGLFGGMFRYPERFGVIIVIAFALFSLKTLTTYLHRYPRWQPRIVLALMIVVLLDSRFWHSIPIQPQPERYAIYEQMGREPYEYIVVEVPTGGSSGEGIVGIPEYSALQFYGITHNKRMINGHISRINTGHYTWMYTEDPMMSWLGQRRYIQYDLVRSQLTERVYSYPIGYIVIHTDLIDPYAPTQLEIIGYFNAQGDLLCAPIIEREIVAFRTRWHPDGCEPRTPPLNDDGAYVIDVGSPDDQRFLGWGFHPPESIFDVTVRWAGGVLSAANVFFDLPPNDYTMTITAQSFHQPRRLEVNFDGSPIGSVEVTPDALNAYHFTIPAAMVRGENLNLNLGFNDGISPAELGQGIDTRQLTLMIDTITFVPE